MRLNLIPVYERPTWFCRCGAVVLIASFLVALHGTVFAQQFTLKGVVVDSSGASVDGAEVKVSGPNFASSTTTSIGGSFIFSGVPISSGTVSISKAGFAPLKRDWTEADNPLRIVLAPAPREEQVTVSATRTPAIVADTANSVVLVSRADLANSGALTLDDTLRQVPGFTLFRRAGSLAANPTTQGVSLRGTGGSGAGRALVLHNGVPINDPFGGWVYWDRIPQISVQEVEVLRGGASDLYGAGALSGVVTLQPRRPTLNEFSAETYYGNSSTPEGAGFWNVQMGKTSLHATGEAFSSDGYFIVREQDRGAVDSKAGQTHYTGSIGVAQDLSNGRVIFGDVSLFREERGNGTELQMNHTRIGQVVAGTDWTLGKGSLNLRAYAEG